MRCAVELFVRRSVDGAVVVTGETLDRLGSEDVCVDNVVAEVGCESNA